LAKAVGVAGKCGPEVARALAEYSDGKPRVAKEDDDEEPVPGTPPPDEAEKQEAIQETVQRTVRGYGAIARRRGRLGAKRRRRTTAEKQEAIQETVQPNGSRFTELSLDDEDD